MAQFEQSTGSEQHSDQVETVLFDQDMGKPPEPESKGVRRTNLRGVSYGAAAAVVFTLLATAAYNGISDDDGSAEESLYDTSEVTSSIFVLDDELLPAVEYGGQNESEMLDFDGIGSESSIPDKTTTTSVLATTTVASTPQITATVENAVEVPVTTIVPPTTVAPETTVPPTTVDPSLNEFGLPALIGEYKGVFFDCNGQTELVPNVWPANIADTCDDLNGDAPFDLSTILNRNSQFPSDEGIQILGRLLGGQLINLGEGLPAPPLIGLSDKPRTVQGNNNSSSGTTNSSGNNSSTGSQSLKDRCPSLGGSWGQAPSDGMLAYFRTKGYDADKQFLYDAMRVKYGLDSENFVCLPGVSVIEATLN